MRNISAPFSLPNDKSPGEMLKFNSKTLYIDNVSQNPNYNCNNISASYYTQKIIQQNDSFNKPSSQSLKILHLNIQGLRNKLTELEHFTYDNSQTVLIALNEHWILDSEEIKTLNFKNYNISTHFCRKRKERGGVLIYTREDIKAEVINVSRFLREFHFEVCAVYLPKFKTAVITIYRSPDADIEIYKSRLLLMLADMYIINTSINIYIYIINACGYVG